VKSPGPTNIHWSTMPITVLDAQYSPRPAGATSTNHEKSAGIIQSIMACICCC